MIFLEKKTKKQKKTCPHAQKIAVLYDRYEHINLPIKDLIKLFKGYYDNVYFAIIGREEVMIPFLTVKDNLLLGIPHKSHQYYLEKMMEYSQHFKLNSDVFSLQASRLSPEEQLILQIIRSLTLKQTIVMIDKQDSYQASQFLLDLMPIMYHFNTTYHLSITILTTHESIVASQYYDLCTTIENSQQFC